ncbi:MAG TPA: hypothetical protein DF984_00310 [Anaerolineaceae bacterium]|nr:hypothetical protein [Anaerolineaceae bacterium]
MSDQAQRKVFDMVEQGRISADEGLQLINALHGNQHDKVTVETAPQSESDYSFQKEAESHSQSIPDEELDRMKKLKRWWILPFALGLIITLSGAIWMYSGYLANGFGWGFWLSWFPFLIGIVLVAVSFPTAKSLWLHVRIKQKEGETPQQINISFPLPLRIAKWGMATFGDKIPDIKGQKAGDISVVLDNITPDAPLYVHVEDDDGEDVEVFIG